VSIKKRGLSPIVKHTTALPVKPHSDSPLVESLSCPRALAPLIAAAELETDNLLTQTAHGRGTLGVDAF